LSEALTNLAKQFGTYGESFFSTAFPAYKSGMDYFQTLLTGDRQAIQSAVAPTTEKIVEGYSAQRRALGAGLLRGGARDLAEAELARQEASDIARTYQGVQPAAAQSLVAGGLSGGQEAAGFLGMAGNTYGSLMSTAVSSRLTTEGMQLTKELGLKQIQTQRDLGFASIDLQRDLGYAGIGLQYQQLMSQMDMFNKTFGMQQQQYADKKKQDQWASYAQMAAAAAMIIAKSDERLKQDIQPLTETRDVLAALARLRGVTYRWREAPDAPAEVGVIAQEVQEVLPEIVHTLPSGYLGVDYYRIPAFLIEVAKEQQRQIAALTARVAALEED
jgi:hypothetical protein